MSTGLASILITIGFSILFSVGIIVSNNVIKTQNAKLKIDVNSLSKKLDMEIIKNQELIETLDYIRQTGMIPKKVLENSYQFQNLKSFDKSNKIDNLKNKFKVKVTMSDEKDLSKEELERYIEMQNLSMEYDKNKNK